MPQPTLPASYPARGAVHLARYVRAGAGLALLLVAVAAGAQGAAWWQPPLAVAAALAGLMLLHGPATTPPAALRAALPFAAVVGLLALSADPALRVWQAPTAWLDLARLSTVGTLLALALLLAGAAWTLQRHGRLPRPLSALTFLALPYLLGAFFALAAPGLLSELGQRLGLGLATSPLVQLLLGRAVLLLLLNELLVVGTGWLIDRRWSRDARLHLVLLASALLAAASPQLATLATSALVAGLPFLLRGAALVLLGGAALGALWAQTFLLTGVMLDAIHGRRPSYEVAARHWRDGAGKGAVYSGVFILLVQLLAAAVAAPSLRALLAYAPLPTAAAAGALLYPLARTILESFDGSQPFFLRLARNAAERTGYLRGAVVGLAVALALRHGLPAEGAYPRFLAGLVAGALAYAGVDLLADAWSILRGPRQRLQIWRYYALGALLGGLVGGAIAWYADQAQIAVVAAKFQAYATVSYPGAGRAVERYVIYPLFSKWGATDLGLVEGGVRLLYNESLSGVINWSLAAPLFSINLVFLTALFKRSLAPIHGLFSQHGLVGLVEQGIRVLRWGLWMAPVIYSFLRMAPDPTWYNQDGAVRTMVAISQSWYLPHDGFRAWSLEVFLGLLAYDWFRVLIWFDHMGLRVATLVNLSFIGGDRLDERAAQALGHTGRTHAIPEAIRRFGTWAPLLIPFYIPRGAEWDQVWTGAERINVGAPSLLPAVQTVLLGYALAALAALAITLVYWLRDRPRRVPQAIGQAAPPADPPWAPHHSFQIGNGFYTLAGSADGRCHARSLRVGGRGPELDLSKRSGERLQLCGKFLYLRELDDRPGPLWSLGWQPMRHAGHDYGIARLSPTSLRFVNSRDGLRAEALVEIAEADALEHWRIRLENQGAEDRTIELTTYQELALAAWDGYRRTPAYNAIHVGTCFVRALGALIARNRHLKPEHAKGFPFAREVMFHAAAGDADRVRLVGYQDARPCFLGMGTPAEPEGLLAGRFRPPEDEGLLYGFDPIASLRLLVTVPAGGVTELAIVDGYAPDEQEAARLIAQRLGLSRPEPARLAALFEHARTVDGSLRRDARAPAPFRFSEDGTELVLTGTTPTPWSHVLANPLGHGSVVSNEGEVFSFAGNAQQNGLTPCYLGSVPAQQPGQAIYLLDLDSGEVDTPTFIPHRRADAEHEVVYGLGYAVFRKRTASLEQELTLFMAADEPVELRLLTLRNRLDRTLRLRVVPYLEMMLAELPRDSIDRLEVRTGSPDGALFFANPDNQFQGGWVFVATSLAGVREETVRQRFLGDWRHDWAAPHFVLTGEGDATQHDDGRRIASFAGTLEIAPGGSATLSLALGQVPDLEQAATLAEGYRSVEVVRAALSETRRFWTERLGWLRVETNRPAFDRLVNDWLPYQVAVARLWGRTGPSQRGGAFGFRDQLQDVLSLLLTDPAATRRQILLHARQQFVEGDVLQWWHRSRTGQTGLGARNRASDPHLWLPYLVARYVEATGDHGILKEKLPFLEGRPLPRGVEGVVQVPRPSRDSASLFEHCRRAIDFTLARLGPGGLPLIGTGDWNDGLSEIGRRGRGESVWLGFFLHDVLVGFAGLAGLRGEAEAAAGYRRHAEALRGRLEAMWRGDRYVRVVTDDGIELAWHDALVGAWPALSGAAGLMRGLEALEGALAGLERAHQVLVLSPPFDEDSEVVAGKIADYPPGVRENGGQYSHGSSWLVDAATRLAQEAEAEGDAMTAARLRDRAFELWCKISPLGKTEPALLDRYGLPPHQQPADIYCGPGYELHGGWSWYTGAAGRMLCAAHGMLGLRLVGGELVLDPDATRRSGALRLQRAVHRGRVVATAQAQPVTAR
ncbi:MAG: hypothetical protein U1E17_21355 [Geminicoccaceae bacterium]